MSKYFRNLAKPLAWAALGGLLFLGACKKHNTPPGGKKPTGNGRLSDEDSLKYLMYRTMQVSFVNGGRDTQYQLPAYFWNSSVPTLDPLSSLYSNADTLLSVIKGYAINPATSGPYDRYSFLDRTGAQTNQLQNGINGDFGLQVTYVADQNNNTYLYVLYADRNSPAGRAGVDRAWQITAINGNTNISYDGPNGSNTTRVVNAVYYSPTTTFTFLAPDSTTKTLTLSTTNYNTDPVLFDSVYDVNGTEVGYFVFYTFSSITDSVGNPVQNTTRTALTNVFNRFQNAGVRDVIIDLRYNGGGDVGTSEFIDSAMAPPAAAGQVMYNITYNTSFSQNATSLGLPSQVKFGGVGGLSLDHIFFITTRNTASASELTLNNLKPYMSVKVVGDTTYGKPVADLVWPLSDYDSTGNPNFLAYLYSVAEATSNAQEIGGYYTGIPADAQAFDYVNIPWGDAGFDDNLVHIFNYISTGNFRLTGARTVHPGWLRARIPGSIPLHGFHDMVNFSQSRALWKRARIQPLFRRK